MPSGRTHDQITLWSLPAVTGLTLLVSRSALLTLILSGSFLFSGLMFGPDLDIHSCQFRRWGLLRYLWVPYQKALRHRSVWSHGFLIGTLVRLLYLGVWLSLFTLLLAIPSIWLELLPWTWQDLGQMVQSHPWQTYQLPGVALLIGLEAGAMSHSWADWLGTRLKRWRKQSPPKQQPKSRSQRRKRP